MGAAERSSTHGPRVFRAPVYAGERAWSRSEIHDSGGSDTDIRRIESGKCDLKPKSSAHAQIKPNVEVEVRRYQQRGGSDAYQEEAVTGWCCA